MTQSTNGNVGKMFLQLFHGRTNPEQRAKARKCEACYGHGWLTVSVDGAEPPEGYVFVQRCDLCSRFKSDNDAATEHQENGHGAALAVLCRGSAVGKRRGSNSPDAPIDEVIGCNVRGRLEYIEECARANRKSELLREIASLMRFFPTESEGGDVEI